MSDRSKIEWTDASWNPIVGCTPVSPGCQNCYAAAFASRFGAVWGDVAAHGKWTGQIMLRDSQLDRPLSWRKPRRVFVCSMGDLFHESVPRSFVARVFRTIDACPRHTFMVLTKRPERLEAVLPRQEELEDGLPARMYGQQPVFRNVLIGVSVESQTEANRRMPHLVALSGRGWRTFVSAEPLLGPLNLAPWLPQLQGVIVGGESGPRARPMNPLWVRKIRDDCVKAGVPFFFKDWGAWTPDPWRDWKTSEVYEGFQDERMFRHGRDAKRCDRHRQLDGRTWDQLPGSEVTR